MAIFSSVQSVNRNYPNQNIKIAIFNYLNRNPNSTENARNFGSVPIWFSNSVLTAVGCTTAPKFLDVQLNQCSVFIIMWSNMHEKLYNASNGPLRHGRRSQWLLNEYIIRNFCAFRNERINRTKLFAQSKTICVLVYFHPSCTPVYSCF